MDTENGGSAGPEDNNGERKEVNAKFVQSATYGEDSKVESNSYHVTEILLCRKAYMAVRDLNNNPELSHLIEEAHHTESDQRHHIKVPEDLISTARHMISEIVRKMTINIKKGRSRYGEITRKNLMHCVSQLHG